MARTARVRPWASSGYNDSVIEGLSSSQADNYRMQKYHRVMPCTSSSSCGAGPSGRDAYDFNRAVSAKSDVTLTRAQALAPLAS